MSTFSSSSSSSESQSLSLKKLIQPFVMKCHPDMARQQGLPETARKVNLHAIQNLNSYIDGVHKLMKNSSSSNNQYPFPHEGHTVEIEFVIPMNQNPAETTAAKSLSHPHNNNNATTKNKNHQFVVSTSRRKLELLVPPSDMPPAKVQHYATRQFLKLLRISDLPVPTSLSLYDHHDDDDNDDGFDQKANPVGGEHPNHGQKQRGRKVSSWEASRERFWRKHNKNVDHKRFHQMYKEALRDAEVHTRTRNWIRDNPKLRHRLLANVLSTVKFVESISPLEKLVAYRRLLKFLDENFDELRLEDSGKYWEEQTTLMVGEPRPYNSSPSALRKFRKKKKHHHRLHQQHFDTGYAFAIHHDNKVTVTIPIDFDNHELLQELLRNMEDFLQTQGTGLDGDYYSAMYGQEDSIL